MSRSGTGGVGRRTVLLGAGVLGLTAALGPSRARPASRYLRGVNAAGADFDVGSRFDTDASFAFYSDRRHRLVRLPFLWESVQPRPGASLDEPYLDQLLAAVTSCTSRGMVCLLDVHNYARHGEEVIGGGRLTGDHLADLWTRLVERVADDDLVQIGLMNEPHDTPDGPAGWQRVVQDCVTAVRRTGATSFIWVPGEQWASAATWSRAHPRWWVDDPLGRSGAEGHYYFDAGNLRRGTYPGTYAADEAVARDEGFIDLREKVETELGDFVAYCRREGVRGLLGEIGWPNDSRASVHPEDAPRWDALGEAAYRLLDAGGLDVTHWAAGEQWGEDYNLSVYTGTPQQQPTSVAAVLQRHPSTGDAP